MRIGLIEAMPGQGSGERRSERAVRGPAGFVGGVVAVGWRWEYGAVRKRNVSSCDAEVRAFDLEEPIAVAAASLESVWP